MIDERKTNIIVIISSIIGFSIVYYCVNLTEDPKYFKFNYKVANYHTIDKFLFVSNIVAKKTKKNSDFSYILRHQLLDQYIEIKNSFSSDWYNSIGLFYSLCYDFYMLYDSNEYNNKLSEKEKERYSVYKERFKSEVEDLLMEYRYRNKTISNFIDVSDKSGAYQLPNRIYFYPVLADIYLSILKSMELTQENFEKLQYFYETYDVVYNQEKAKNSYHYKNYYERDKSYAYFVANYTANIIRISNILYPEIDICSTTNYCDSYKEMVKKTNKTIPPDIAEIIE